MAFLVCDLFIPTSLSIQPLPPKSYLHVFQADFSREGSIVANVSLQRIQGGGGSGSGMGGGENIKTKKTWRGREKTKQTKRLGV
jgi:hypothetical protein